MLPDQVQANLIEYHRLFADVPGISFVDEDIVYIACPGLPESGGACHPRGRFVVAVR